MVSHDVGDGADAVVVCSVERCDHLGLVGGHGSGVRCKRHVDNDVEDGARMSCLMLVKRMRALSEGVRVIRFAVGESLIDT